MACAFEVWLCHLPFSATSNLSNKTSYIRNRRKSRTRTLSAKASNSPLPSPSSSSDKEKQHPNPIHNDNDVDYIVKITSACVAAAFVIKYGSLLLPNIVRNPNLFEAVAIVTFPVLVAIAILWAASSKKD